MIFQYSEKEKRAISEAERLKDISSKHSIFYCTKEDERYPSALKKMNNMPALLYYKGNIEIINNNRNVPCILPRT